MKTLYVIREDVKDVIRMVRLIQAHEHTVYCFPENPMLSFMRTLISYPNGRTYDKIIFLIPKDTVISKHFKNIDLCDLHKNIVIRYI